LGWRLDRGGWITRYEPRARVLHEAGAATTRAFGDEKRVKLMSATYEVIRRRSGRVAAAAIAGVNIAGAAVRFAWTAPLALLSGRFRLQRDENLRWLRAHARGWRRAEDQRIAQQA